MSRSPAPFGAERAAIDRVVRVAFNMDDLGLGVFDLSPVE